jgi:hypothetical protein
MANRIISVSAFIILSALWLAFAAALVFNRDLLETAWISLRSWPLLVELAVWLLALPVVLGLWIWQTGWPVLLRLVLVLGLAWVTVYTFFPWKSTRRQATIPPVS